MVIAKIKIIKLRKNKQEMKILLLVILRIIKNKFNLNLNLQKNIWVVCKKIIRSICKRIWEYSCVRLKIKIKARKVNWLRFIGLKRDQDLLKYAQEFYMSHLKLSAHCHFKSKTSQSQQNQLPKLTPGPKTSHSPQHLSP